MSELIKAGIEIKDQAALVDALKALKLEHEVHETPVNINGYRGVTELKANIIVRRSTWGTYTDLGFLKNPDGTFTTYCDDRALDKLGPIKQEYARASVERAARSRGWTVRKQVGQNGKIIMTVTVP
jgi:hypothetical protein